MAQQVQCEISLKILVWRSDQHLLGSVAPTEGQLNCVLHGEKAVSRKTVVFYFCSSSTFSCVSHTFLFLFMFIFCRFFVFFIFLRFRNLPFSFSHLFLVVVQLFSRFFCSFVFIIFVFFCLCHVFHFRVLSIFLCFSHPGLRGAQSPQGGNLGASAAPNLERHCFGWLPAVSG